MTSFVATPTLLGPTIREGLKVRKISANPFWGPLPEIRRDRLGTFQEMVEGVDAASFRVGHKRIHLLNHPDQFRHVLVDEAGRYRKQTRGYREMARVVGQGLLTAEDEHWLRQRRLAAPAFHKKRIEAFAGAFSSIAREEAENWAAGRVRDVAHDMMSITLRIVEKTLFSSEAQGAERDLVGQALTVGLGEIVYRMDSPWALPMWVPVPRNRRYRRAIDDLNRVVDGIIAGRRQARALPSEEKPGDLLDMLMEAKDEATGESMTDRQLRDEVMTILLAGHETTAMTLSWTLLLLAQNPEWEAKLREELAPLEGRAPTLADLSRLPVVDRVVHESLRIYPPAWVVARACVEEDQAPGLRVRPGDWVFLSPFLLHRRPDLWPDPLRFDPDRFLPEAVASRHRYAWVPFSTGQRKCIGDQFALMEAKLVLAVLLQRFRFRMVTDHPVVPEPLVTLRPKDGLLMRLLAA